MLESPGRSGEELPPQELGAEEVEFELQVVHFVELFGLHFYAFSYDELNYLNLQTESHSVDMRKVSHPYEPFFYGRPVYPI